MTSDPYFERNYSLFPAAAEMTSSISQASSPSRFR